MDRRNFFNILTDGSTFRSERTPEAVDVNVPPRPVQTQAITPRTTPLTRADAFHLLRRITFAPTIAMVNQLIGKTPAQAIALLLGDPNNDQPAESPGAWIDTEQENPDNVDIVTRAQIEGAWRGTYAQLMQWWVNQMQNETFPAREKLTLFWSGHFTSEFTYDLGFIPPQLLYRQNILLRKDRLASFRKFLEDITIDGAMLDYLGGTLNVRFDAARKTGPNENYARELMELFSCGIGWYSEGDVKEAARVLTGWKTAKYLDSPKPNGKFASYFIPRDHDIGAKQFMGRTIPARDDTTNTEFLVLAGEVRTLIDILLTERATQVSLFLARKLYRYFVYSSPSISDQEFIDSLAALFRENQFNIRPVVEAILMSEHFYDTNNRGVQIKTPAEFVVGLGRQLGVPVPTGATSMMGMEQSLFDPPNVAGWDGYRTWISTKTYPNRIAFAKGVILAMSDSQAQTFVKQFPDYSDVHKLIAALLEYFLPVAATPARITYFTNTLLQSAPDYEWSNIVENAASCGGRVRSLLTALVKSPDFHLC